MRLSQNVPTTDPTTVQSMINSIWSAMSPYARERMKMTVIDAQGVELDFQIPATPSISPDEPDSSTPR